MLGDLRMLALATGRRPPHRDAPSEAAPAPAGSSAAGVRELLLDTERATLQALFDMIRRFKVGYEVRAAQAHARARAAVADRPAAASARRRADARGPRAREHAREIDGIAALAVRTDVGVDLICEAADTRRC